MAIMRLHLLMIRISILLISFLPIFVHAGAWTKAKGEGYSQLSFTYIKSHSLFLEDGRDLELRRDVTDMTLQGYLEYGLTDKFTLLGVLPFKFTSTGDELFPTTQFKDTLEAGSLSGLSNIMIGFKQRLFNKKYVGSFQLTFESWHSRYDAPTGLRTGYESMALSPSFLIGRGWDKTFFSAELGIKYRTNSLSHQWKAGIEVGRKFGDKTWIIAVVDDLESFHTGKSFNGNAEHTGLYVNNQESFSYGAKFIHSISDSWAVNLAGYGAFAGNKVAHFPALVAGISYEWKRKKKE